MTNAPGVDPPSTVERITEWAARLEDGLDPPGAIAEEMRDWVAEQGGSREPTGRVPFWRASDHRPGPF